MPRSPHAAAADPALGTTSPGTPVAVAAAARRPRRSRPVVLAGLVGVVVVAAALVAAVADRTPGVLTVADAVVLGVVEGVTEYLPVSSTGHLAVVQRLLGVTADDATTAAADAYAICIQLGAILAVIALYRHRLTAMLKGLAGRDEEGRRLAWCLAVAFVPAAVTGLVLGDAIKQHLFGIGPVVAAWAVGGVAILVLAPRLVGGRRRLEQLTTGQALVIGLAQTLALWPGVSRSLVTILAALALGLAARAAVELSFLLGLATLGAATIYQGVGEGGAIVQQFGLTAPLVGLVAALVSALVAVRWLVEYLTRRSLAVFGWYRLGVAGVVAALALSPAW